jgi:hypothetical protein
MQPLKGSDSRAYQKIVNAFRKRQSSAAAADIVAATALPLEKVRFLLPVAADEYRGRLEVSESGEILYSFPRGFTSRYHGFSVFVNRAGKKSLKILGIACSRIFKIWIMLMLVGYFALFMLIALASLMLTMVAAGNSRSNNRSGNRSGNSGGGFYFAGSIFNLIMRLWFYSEISRSVNRNYGRPNGSFDKTESKKKPLHKSIYSFVFGGADPNKDWKSRERRDIIAKIQSHNGVISLPDFMTAAGLTPYEAEEEILSYCREFGGMPEATEEGTIVYRFDELLKTNALTEGGSHPAESYSAEPPLKRLKQFSENSKGMNTGFALINAVNLLFGGYFFYHALNTGSLVPIDGVFYVSTMYDKLYAILAQFVNHPLGIIVFGLGFVPLAFSVLFWLVPALRYHREQKENEQARLLNLRKIGFYRIWSKPASVTSGDIESKLPECRPKKFSAAQDRIIKEMGAYSVPDIEMGNSGETIYHFKGLELEKSALEKYRENMKSTGLGNIVFDSDEQV